MKSLTAAATRPQLEYVKADPDFELLHDDSRYQAMLATAEARLGVAKVSPTSVGNPTESRT